MVNSDQITIEKNVVCITCRDKNDENNVESGTGFFIDNDLLITAAHVIQDYPIGTGQYDIYVDYENQHIHVEEIVKQNDYVALLKLSKINDIKPMKFVSGYPVERGLNCTCYGYPIFANKDGYWIKDGKIMTGSKNDISDWNISVPSGISGLGGLSGAPVFINDMLVGIIQTEIIQEMVILISFSSVNCFKEILPHKYYEVYSNILEIETLKKDGFNIMTINDVDNDLKTMAKAPYKLSLDFFEIDDDQFKNQFKLKIEDNEQPYYKIDIIGISREETLYGLLNELKQYSMPTLVIKDRKTWEGIKNQVKNFIIIPNFYDGRDIPSIIDNINIFIYLEDEHFQKDSVLQLRKRTRQTIEIKLQKIGMTNVDVFFEQTSGFYISLKRYIFNGKINTPPNWADKHTLSFIVALLCGKWTNNKFDQAVITNLAHKSYKSFMDDLRLFMHGSNPFVTMFQDWGNCVNYQIADLELAWDYLFRYISVDENIWNEFITSFKNVIGTIDQNFKNNLKNEYNVIDRNNIQYSSRLKSGMIRSLIFMSIYSKNQHKIDKIINDVISNIKCKEDWAYYSQFIEDLCEASPDCIMDRLEKELEKSSGLIELFNEGAHNNGFMKISYYTKVLWAIEKLLFDKNYIMRGITWLFKIDSLNIQYKMVNSPSGILHEVFCIGINAIPISADEKILLSRTVIKDYKNAWNIIFDEIPHSNFGRVIHPLARPRYRQLESNFEVITRKDIIKVYNEYIRLCVTNINNNLERLEKILSIYKNIPDDMTDQLSKISSQFLHDCDDEKRLLLMQNLRKLIYDNKYFNNAIWKMSNEQIHFVESVLNMIAFSDMYYYYVYWLRASLYYPILDPVSFKGTENRDDENNKRRAIEMKQKFSEFNARQLNIYTLIKIAVDKHSILENDKADWQYNIGYNLAKYYSNNHFDIQLYKQLLNIPNIQRLLLTYFIGASNQQNVEGIINEIKDITIQYDENLYVDFIAAANSNNCSFIYTQTDDIKKLYWERWDPYRFHFETQEAFEEVLKELKLYDQCDSYIFVLFEGIKKVSSECIMNYIGQIRDFHVISNKKIDFQYYADEIIQYLEQENLSTENRHILCEVEFYLAPILDWKQLTSLQHAFRFNPTYYAKIIDQIYKHEGEENNSLNEAFDNWYAVYQKAKFCPCNENGLLNENEFLAWLESFKKLLIQQKQKKIYFIVVGKLFANSSVGNDGAYPHEVVRKTIESLNKKDFKIVKNNYIIEKCNERGTYSVNEGKTSRELALKYKDNAEKIRFKYSKTAQIYDFLSKSYMEQSQQERIAAENE